MKHGFWILMSLWLGATGLLAQTGEKPATSCIVCHRDPDVFDEQSRRVVELFASDIHSQVGLSCQDCHGGNPEPSLASDGDAAMDPGFRANPFRGAPAHGSIPATCGKCHSNPGYMKRFKPDIRIDQESEYWTSRHGLALRKGDNNVATCVDCHGAHGILRPSDPNSPVYPTRVADTCGRCHSDAKRMASYKRPDGTPLPVDQQARWKQSVHAASMLEKEDLTAPTCNDCHGNHGATPPGLESIGFVCGQCHGREADLFRKSSKHDGWQQHNEFLKEAGGQGCAGCHTPPEPAAAVKGVHTFSECTSCHGNHGIVRPTVALFSSLPKTPCAFCHEGEMGGGSESGLVNSVAAENRRRRYEDLRNTLIEEAEAAGLQGDALFDSLVDKAVQLPTHTSAEGSDGAGTPALRPEFARLFNKFRIGKTYYTYIDPTTGQEVQQPLIRCGNCHGTQGAQLAAAKVTAGERFLSGMKELTSLTATAERVLLAAQRGGVETRGALTSIDKAIDSQIGMEVLVHTFNPEGAFADKHKEGVESAQAALDSGYSAIGELTSRRTGLFVSLAFIGLVLIGLALKIRQISGASR